MQPAWLIEAGVYRAEADPLLAEIRRQGMAAEGVLGCTWTRPGAVAAPKYPDQEQLGATGLRG